MLRILAICALGLANGALAQTGTIVAWPIDSGSVVRVSGSTLGSEVRRGTLVATTPDSLVIVPKDQTAFSVHTATISKLEVMRGTHTAKAKYALVGLLIGAAGGAALGASTYSDSCGQAEFCLDFGRGFAAASGAVLLGAVGALIGTINGASPKETWIPVLVPSR
jgi:hypothetical protein